VCGFGGRSEGFEPLSRNSLGEKLAYCAGSLSRVAAGQASKAAVLRNV